MDGQESPIDRSGTSVITVRLPRTMHERLKDEAHVHRTTLNKLCVQKLTRSLESSLQAEEAG